MTNSAPSFATPPARLVRTGLQALVLGLFLLAPVRLHGQQGVPPAATPTVAPGEAQDSVSQRAGVSPGGAFLRAALLPGWGHASIGSYTRGAFYFAAELTTAWGFLRTQARIGEARDRAALREAVLRSRLEDDGEDAEAIEEALAKDETLQDLNDLASAREDEREDWAALGIFLVFLSGADAFVSAHLKDFPTPITLDAAPLPGGRMELRVGVKLPR